MKVYKVVRHLDTGEMVSSYVDPDNINCHFGTKRLQYFTEKRTTAPKDSNGIYCSFDLSEVKRHAIGNCHHDGSVVEIWRANSIGKQLEHLPSDFSYSVRFPAVRLVEKVFSFPRGENTF